MYKKIIRILLACLAVLMLGGGGSCAFVASSGSSGSKDQEQQSNLVVIINGQFVDAPVEGLGFTSGGVSGVTGADGGFQFEEGGSIRFFIGDIPLGDPVPAKSLMTPLDLVEGGSLDTPAVINIARLLQSLDAQTGDRRITIPAHVRDTASLANREIAAALTFIEFADDTRFTNTASQLVASLTAGYPFTAVLVDADTARRHLEANLTEMGLVGR